MRSGYSGSLQSILDADELTILGALSEHLTDQGFAVTPDQNEAWREELAVLRSTAEFLASNGQDIRQWFIVLEYEIPRRAKRIDAVLLVRDCVLVLEFKTGTTDPGREAIRQVEDYCLDLADFHAESASATVFPIVVAGVVRERLTSPYGGGHERVMPTQWVIPSTLGRTVLDLINSRVCDSAVLSLGTWTDSRYQPVPGILEAASSLFLSHSVDTIAHSGASNDNLAATADTLVEAVQHAKATGKKIACFVTGVPGAGKTLAGLNAVHSDVLRNQEGVVPVFLSGNGPLVRIVSEALARNYATEGRVSLAAARRTVKTFVQSVHSFIREHARVNASLAPERVIVFDEAQRAWDAAKMTRSRARNRSRREAVAMPEGSEPELLLGALDRNEGWAVLVALIGGGQEINDGEAGIAEWGRALAERFSAWEVWVAPEALSATAGVGLQGLVDGGGMSASRLTPRSALHLSVSVRSIRTTRHSEWVDALLSGESSRAAEIAAEMGASAPRLVRSFSELRSLLRESCRGTRRSGLVASSGALRLRAEGIEVSSSFTNQLGLYEDWFLEPASDIRSSNSLEVAATEFNCQGLELDWVGLCWGDDFTRDQARAGWRCRRFRGGKWQQVNRSIDRQYLINKYRVLLTRAREGLVIWIPMGDSDDTTRNPSFLDETAAFLISSGARSTTGW